jgi:hypothetical protein
LEAVRREGKYADKKFCQRRLQELIAPLERRFSKTLVE